MIHELLVFFLSFFCLCCRYFVILSVYYDTAVVTNVGFLFFSLIFFFPSPPFANFSVLGLDWMAGIIDTPHTFSV